MGIGIGTCCCECETGLNYVYVRPGVPINLQILRFVAQVKDFDSVSGLQYCSYVDLEAGATLVYQSTADGVHTFRQYNQWTGYDPGDRPPLNASITDITLGISATFESIPGMTYLQKARIEWIEFRRIYGASSATDYTYRYELNDGQTKLVKASGTCGCVRKFSPPQTGAFGNRWIYPPRNITQLRLLTGAFGFDPSGSKLFTMSVSGLVSPWDVLNFSGATLSWVGGNTFQDGFADAFRHDGTISGKTIIFQCGHVRETDDREIGTGDLFGPLVGMGSISISDGSHVIALVPSNLDTTAKRPDLGSDWSTVEWKAAYTYSGFGTAPDVTGVSVSITETP